MADNLVFDFTQLSKLAADLLDAPAKSGPKIRQAVEISARYIKDDWRKNLPKEGHAKALPYAVSYDIEVEGEAGGAASVISAEIGPDKDKRQGALGNLLEFGSINNKPEGVGHAALEREQADFQRGLGIAIGDPLD